MTDNEILKLIRNNDGNGLSVLYEAYRSEFLHWIRRFAHCDQDEAKEYYQAAVLIVYENVHQGTMDNLKSSLKTYLFGIGKNLAWQSYRQDIRKQKAGAAFYLENYITEQSPELAQWQDHQLDLVRECFQLLGDPCRTLLDLHYFQRKSMEEISSQLAYKNADTAKNQKYKCMERLRRMVEERTVTHNQSE